MKKRVSRDLIIFVVLIPIFLWIAFQISSSLGGGLPSYSIINRSKNGISVFYEALEELKIPVNRSMRSLGDEDVNSVQIAAKGGDFDVNDETVKNWVKDGGTLIYLTNEKFPSIGYGVTPEIRENIFIYKYPKGTLIVANADDITNVKLARDSHNAYKLLEVIYEYSDKKIYFNESHLYSAAENPSLWSAVPVQYKYIAYQLLIALGFYFYYKGKRFGKPIPLHEEVERTENEYLYSAAALYRASGAWDLMLDNYYKSFLNAINKSDEDWLEYWEREKLPYLDRAKEVYKFIHRDSSRVKKREYINAVGTLDRLRNIYEKGRESYWKTLKGTL